MRFHHCMRFQVQMEMAFQQLSAFCIATDGSETIQSYSGGPIRLTRVSGRIVCNIQTILYVAHVTYPSY